MIVRGQQTKEQRHGIEINLCGLADNQPQPLWKGVFERVGNFLYSLATCLVSTTFPHPYTKTVT